MSVINEEQLEMTEGNNSSGEIGVSEKDSLNDFRKKVNGLLNNSPDWESGSLSHAQGLTEFAVKSLVAKTVNWETATSLNIGASQTAIKGLISNSQSWDDNNSIVLGVSQAAAKKLISNFVGWSTPSPNIGASQAAIMDLFNDSPDWDNLSHIRGMTEHGVSTLITTETWETTVSGNNSDILGASRSDVKLLLDESVDWTDPSEITGAAQSEIGRLISDSPGDWASTTIGASQNAIKTAFGQGVPTATVITWAGTAETADTIPDGYLMCDGSWVLQLEYPDLFAAISHAYTYPGDANPPESADKFQLPDLSDRFVRGTTKARVVGTREDDQLRNHKHSDRYTTGTTNTAKGGKGDTCLERVTELSDAYVLGSYPISAVTADGATQTDPNAGNESRPKNIALHYLIKT